MYHFMILLQNFELVFIDICQDKKEEKKSRRKWICNIQNLAILRDNKSLTLQNPFEKNEND